MLFASLKPPAPGAEAGAGSGALELGFELGDAFLERRNASLDLVDLVADLDFHHFFDRCETPFDGIEALLDIAHPSFDGFHPLLEACHGSTERVNSVSSLSNLL